MSPLPDLVLYARPGCDLCDEAREAIELVIEDRRTRGLAVPSFVERDIEVDDELHRRLLERIPVVEIGNLRVELIVTVGKVRRLLNEAFGDAAVSDPDTATAAGTEASAAATTGEPGA
jgi:hypothetical protein